MKRHGDFEKTKRSERMAIFEMIDASCELAAKKGAHPPSERLQLHRLRK